MSKKAIIIGSGIAGISSSLKLKSYGINSIILDKGNFIGGRISTKEVEIGSSSSYFFHGAQFFTAKTHEFKKIISTGVSGKYIKEFGNFDPKRYRGNKTMREFLLNLSKDLHIQQKVEVIGIKTDNNKIKVLDNKVKEWISYDGIISTLPAPQNCELLNQFPSLQKTLNTGSYHACIALMFTFEEIPLGLNTYYDFYKKPGILSWMASGSNLNVWTAHTNEAFSDLNYYKDKNFLKEKIMSSIKQFFFSSKIKFHSLHVWRYAKVAKKCLGPQIDPKYPVAIAGDFLEGPSVEAAFISGNKAANLIFDRLK